MGVSIMTTRAVGDLIHRKVLEFIEIHDCSYQHAFHEVLNKNPSLKGHLYRSRGYTVSKALSGAFNCEEHQRYGS
jgi:hypothetical protein